MDILNKKILNKAIELIKNNNFGREWDNLFENSEEQCFNLFHDLYAISKNDSSIKELLLKNECYMPTIVLNAIKGA